MRKMKKIITLAMTLVMMMAMSITAFADETVTTVTGPTIKVTNISNREGKAADGADVQTNVKVYKLATVDTTANTVIVEKWAENVYPSTLTDEFVATDLNAALEAALKDDKATLVKEDISTNGSDVEFTGLDAGAYVIKVTGVKVQYNLMVAVTATTDANGNYVAKDSTVELKAKGSTNHVDKTAEDTFVKAGDVVPFTITTTVPYNVSEFKVFDKQLNLQAPTNVVVKVAEETKTGFSFDEGVVGNDGYTTYTMDLSSLVYANDKKINDNAGATVVITYNAVVVGADGFVNEAYDSTNGNHKIVTGITAHITLAKLDQDGNEIKGTTDDAVAEFEVTDTQNNKLKFKLENGVYVLSDAQDANATVKTDKTTGKVTVAGLEEGTYHFTETKAPKGYSINPAGVTKVVAETDTATEGTRVVSYNVTLTDSTLIQLPFTGGMGTTIFTILGVAIMAMAAALFFATKKSR